MSYKRTHWKNGETPLNAQNLNNIEDGIEEVKDFIDNVYYTQVPIYSKNLFPYPDIISSVTEVSTTKMNAYIIQTSNTEKFNSNLATSKPIVKNTYTSGYGNQIQSTFKPGVITGWFELSKKGKYTFKNFNFCVDSKGNKTGYLGVFTAVDMVSKRIKFMSNNYYTVNTDGCALGDGSNIKDPLVRLVEPSNYGSTKNNTKIVIEKTTDDLLLFTGFISNRQDYKPEGYSTADADIKDSDYDLLLHGFMVYEGTEDINEYEEYSKEPLAYKKSLVFDKSSINGLENDLDNIYNDINKLNDRINVVEDKVNNIDTSTNKKYEDITLENSAKVGFFGNSFLDGYTLKGHHPVVHLNGLLDYQFYNYSQSGDDILETLERITNNKTKYGNITSPKDWQLDYGVIAQQDNDGALYNFNTETYYENSKKLGNYLKSFGTIPVFGTEHDNAVNYYNMMRLCKEEGYMFMQWGRDANDCKPVTFRPLAFSSHPATRTHWVWTLGMLQYLKTLPKVRKGIKIYKSRDNSYALDDLKYDNSINRFKKWAGISGGYTRLSDESAKYYDRWDGNNSNTNRTVNVSNEYLDLREHKSISLTNKSLIEIITPYTSKSINELQIRLDATYSKAYIRRLSELKEPLTGKRYLSFGLGENQESAFPKGATIVISAGQITGNVAGTYVVQDIVNGIVITNTLSSGKTTSGTDVLKCTVNGTAVLDLKGSYDWPSSQYANEWNKPLMEWDLVEFDSNGLLILDKDDLKNYMDYDKVSILLENNTAVIINSISSKVNGFEEKDLQNRNKITLPVKGTALLSEYDFAKNKDSWTNVGDVTYPAKFTCTTTQGSFTETYPTKVLSIVRLNKDSIIQKALSNINTDSYTDPILQIKLIARYLPQTTFTDEDYARNELFENTNPLQSLKIGLGSALNNTKNITYFADVEVGLWWHTFVVNIPYYATNSILSIKSESDNLEVALIEVSQIDNTVSININS